METVIEQLRKMNQTFERMLAVMEKPENKILRVLQVVGAGVGALGFLGLIDIIRNWIIGGQYGFSNYHKCCVHSYWDFDHTFSPVFKTTLIR
jgi:preprotein translocase subunit Sss1